MMRWMVFCTEKDLRASLVPLRLRSTIEAQVPLSVAPVREKKVDVFLLQPEITKQESFNVFVFCWELVTRQGENYIQLERFSSKHLTLFWFSAFAFKIMVNGHWKHYVNLRVKLESLIVFSQESAIYLFLADLYLI